MGKLHIQDSIEDQGQGPQVQQAPVPPQPTQSKESQEVAQGAPAPPVPPAPVPPSASGPGDNEKVNSKENQLRSNSQRINAIKKINLEGIPMGEEEGIVIDLGDGISLNVPIKKRMTLHEFLRVAEKVKALEMLSDEGQRGY